MNKIFFYYKLSLLLVFLMFGCASYSTRFPATEISGLDIKGAEKPYQRFYTSTVGMTHYFRNGVSATSPLIIILQGSGCRSFFKKESSGEYFTNKLLETVDHLNPLVSIFMIEKPFVETFSQVKESGSSGCNEEFKKNFVKEFWIERIKQTLRDVLQSKKIKPERIIVAGHSEGAEIAAFLSEEIPEITHVLMGAGGGAVQLYEFVTFTAKETKDDPKNQSKAIQYTLNQWKQMNKNPMALEPLFAGHPPRYWTTFKRTSPGESLKKTNAKIYIMQGTEDNSVPVESADWLASELTSANKDFIYERIPGLDHAFKDQNESRFIEVWTRALQWALK